MFNILKDELPSKINEIKINTSYKAIIEFEGIVEDNRTDKKEKVMRILTLFFDEDVLFFYPAEKLIETVLDFYLCRSEEEKQIEQEKASEGIEKKKSKEDREKLYSFNQDHEYIYSSFVEQYNIDLTKEDMHWYKFKALFHGLSENTKMGEIMKYRAIDLSKIKDKETRKFYAKQKSIYKIKTNKTKEQLEDEFNSQF